MTEKVKVWHDQTWTCLVAHSGTAQATVSLTRLEAALLREKLVPPDARKPWEVHGDGEEVYRLLSLCAGYVLSDADVADIQNLTADWNDEIAGSADIFNDGRLSAIREIGGEELLCAVLALDKAEVDRMTARAMTQLKVALAEREKEAESMPAREVRQQ